MTTGAFSEIKAGLYSLKYHGLNITITKRPNSYFYDYGINAQQFGEASNLQGAKTKAIKTAELISSKIISASLPGSEIKKIMEEVQSVSNKTPYQRRTAMQDAFKQAVEKKEEKENPTDTVTLDQPSYYSRSKVISLPAKTTPEIVVNGSANGAAQETRVAANGHDHKPTRTYTRRVHTEDGFAQFTITGRLKVDINDDKAMGSLKELKEAIEIIRSNSAAADVECDLIMPSKIRL